MSRGFLTKTLAGFPALWYNGCRGKLHMDVRSIPLEELLPPLYPVRRVADDEKMAELVRSIQANGLLHPLVVIPEDGAYRILAGHRRFIAVSGMGWEEVPCNVIEARRQADHMITIEENLIREDANPVDLGLYLRYLCEHRHMTQTEIGQLLGKPQQWVSRYIRLTLVDDESQVATQEGVLPWRSALEIQKVESPGIRAFLRHEAVTREWSVRQTENAVASHKRNEKNIEQAIETVRTVREEQAAEVNPLCCFGCGTPALERSGSMAWLCVGCLRAIEEAKENTG